MTVCPYIQNLNYKFVSLSMIVFMNVVEVCGGLCRFILHVYQNYVLKFTHIYIVCI